MKIKFLTILSMTLAVVISMLTFLMVPFLDEDFPKEETKTVRSGKIMS